jgi:hypothetical protein
MCSTASHQPSKVFCIVPVILIFLTSILSFVVAIYCLNKTDFSRPHFFCDATKRSFILLESHRYEVHDIIHDIIHDIHLRRSGRDPEAANFTRHGKLGCIGTRSAGEQGARRRARVPRVVVINVVSYTSGREPPKRGTEPPRFLQIGLPMLRLGITPGA